MKTKHKQKRIRVRYGSSYTNISVDSKLTEIIKKCWKNGWLTTNSCENNQGKFVWICFFHKQIIDEIFKFIDKHDDILFGYLMSNSSLHLVPIIRGDKYSHMSVSLRFPSEDLKLFSKMFLKLPDIKNAK